MTDPVRPLHYTALSPEPIDVIEGWGLSFALGNVIKYVARAGRKGDAFEDLEKAIYYLQREIQYYKQLRGVGRPPVAFDYGGKPYCSACGDSGSGPCEYHTSRGASRGHDSEDRG